MIKVQHERLERNWKTKVHSLVARGINDTYSWILSGQRLVESYNDMEILKIKYIILSLCQIETN